MSEDNQENSSAPGSGAGDAAPTQAIPRIPKAAKKSPATGSGSQPAKKAAPVKKAAPASKDPAAKSTSAKVSDTSKSTNQAQTDKGRVRESPPSSSAPVTPDKPAAKPNADRERLMRPVGGPQGRTLTAADYATTTKPSPSTTAVIPAVKEKLRDKVKSKDKKKSSVKPTFETSESAGPSRRASLRLTHVEPWSVTRLAFTVSVALMVVGLVAVTIFWVVLEVAGVWDQINGSVTSVLSDDSSSFNITDYLGFGRLVGLTLVLSAINVVLMTALATIAAHLYNLAAHLLGGIEVTFAEEK